MDIGDNRNVNVSISTATMLRLVGVVLLLAFAYAIKDVFILFLVAVVLATALDPWVDALQARRIPRTLGLIIIYVLLFGGISVILGLLIPPLVTQFSELTQNFPAIYQKFINEFQALRDLSGQAGIQQNISSVLQSIQGSVTSAGSSVFSALSGFFGGVIAFIAVLIITFYMVTEESGMKKFFRSIAPLRFQPYLHELITKIQIKMGGWLRGQLLLLLIVAIMSYVGLLLLGIKYALVLALFAGLMEFIPMIGSTIAMVPAAFIAFTQSPTKGILTIVLFIVVQQIENNLIVPKVMKSTTGLHSIVTIVVLLVGAKVAGLLGVILAVPVTLIVMTVYQDIFGKRREEELQLEQ
jgi:predicted PurR-regulated permease PerM